MPLDKLTLHAQMALLNHNGKALNESLAEKTRTVQQINTDIEQTKGAMAYHNLLVQQLQNAITETELAEATALKDAIASVQPTT